MSSKDRVADAPGAAQMLDVLLVGTGEYTTGYVHNAASGSDKRIGVVALVMFDMRRRGRVRAVTLVGTTGRKNAGLRDHLQSRIADAYRGLDVSAELLPHDAVDYDPDAYKAAIDSMPPGSGVTIFTPDDTHYDIALYAIRRGLHVVRSPDARERIRNLGDFGFFTSYMSQPKAQLETFRSWAGKSSDISYYLNAHHIDLHAWALQGIAKPVRVTASSATGVATSAPHNCVPGTEDTITLMVQWKNIKSGNLGTAVYTASWVAPKAEVHSQQRFFYMGHKGEIRVDQAHRGYEMATDDNGYASVNPLFMRYTPDSNGFYAGQSTYGHRSIELWAEACLSIKQGKAKSSDFEGQLPTIRETEIVTAVLEAGRMNPHHSTAQNRLPHLGFPSGTRPTDPTNPSHFKSPLYAAALQDHLARMHIDASKSHTHLPDISPHKSTKPKYATGELQRQRQRWKKMESERLKRTKSIKTSSLANTTRLSQDDISVDRILDPPKRPLTLAEKLGLVPKPAEPLSEASWKAVKMRAIERCDTCPICQEPFTLEDLVVLSCSHVYHHNCLVSYERFVDLKCCPLCRETDYQKLLTGEGRQSFRRKCAIKIQKTWRMWRERRRYLDYCKTHPPKDPRLLRKYHLNRLSDHTSMLEKQVQSSCNDLQVLFRELDASVSNSRQIISNMTEQMQELQHKAPLDWDEILLAATERGIDQCAICIMDLGSKNHPKKPPRPITLLSCSHLYHSSCIQRLERFDVGRSHVCPVCRSKYEKLEIDT
eukprot:jgi/Hompol1/6281/HPOL_002619-RA